MSSRAERYLYSARFRHGLLNKNKNYMGKFTLPKDGGLIEAGLPNGIKHTSERIPAHIFEDEEIASRA